MVTYNGRISADAIVVNEEFIKEFEDYFKIPFKDWHKHIRHLIVLGDSDVGRVFQCKMQTINDRLAERKRLISTINMVQHNI
jgi:hypothetical protein